MLNLSDLSRIKGFRFPRSVICAAAQAYHRFALSLRDVEDLLASRGVRVSCETVQIWVARLGGLSLPVSVASAQARRANGISTKS